MIAEVIWYGARSPDGRATPLPRSFLLLAGPRVGRRGSKFPAKNKDLGRPDAASQCDRTYTKHRELVPTLAPPVLLRDKLAFTPLLTPRPASKTRLFLSD